MNQIIKEFQARTQEIKEISEKIYEKNHEVSNKFCRYDATRFRPSDVHRILEHSFLINISNLLVKRRSPDFFDAILKIYPEAKVELEFMRTFCSDGRVNIKGNEVNELSSFDRHLTRVVKNVRRRIAINLSEDVERLRENSIALYWDHGYWLDAFKDFKTSRGAYHHILDCAHSIYSLRKWDFEKDGHVAILCDEKCLYLTGISDSGKPTFKPEFEIDNRLRLNAREIKATDDDDCYWRIPEFAEAMKRRFWEADTDYEAAAILMNMKAEGFVKAFVKGRVSKTGTFTFDLTKINSYQDALDMINENAGYFFWETQGYLIQEYLPTYLEQRHFIMNSKLVTTVCSDRNFTFLDNRSGKRLDDRVAVLLKPEVDQGNFDRGVTSNRIDRKLSAEFARSSRKLAKELAQYGVTSFVVDWGLTDRGVTAIETNTFLRSGPYCLDRSWILKAKQRSLQNR